MRALTSILPRLALASLALAFGTTSQASAQDNILIYGNSLIDGPTVGFFEDLITQAGMPAANVVTAIGPDRWTSDHLNHLGLITSSLAAGETWDAMIILGGTIEPTDINMPPLVGDPAGFQTSLATIANTFYSHSPNGQILFHETGADHPNSSRYPLWFDDAATWLAFPQAAYAQAAATIDAAHPSSPPVRIANQGTAYAETIGYGFFFYENDLHHMSDMGKAFATCLWFTELYGGRIADLPVDFGVTTPLITNLQSNGIDQVRWDRLAGYADRSQPRALRELPGSDSDFQMRTGPVANQLNVLPSKRVAAGSQFFIRLQSPLDSLESFTAGVYMQVLPTGVTPTTGNIPGLQLDRTQATTWFGVPDLTGGAVTVTIPSNLSGQTIWIQAVSRGPSGSSSYPLTLSDAQRIVVI